MTVLVENTSTSEEYACEHGLSLYIETGSQKILFDTGASDLFYDNAEKLNVDLSSVDSLIISHGHADHGGGLEKFLQVNTKAKVYLHPLAFGKHLALRTNDKMEFIGLEKGLQKNSRFVSVPDQQFTISKGVELFSNVEQIAPLPRANQHLFLEEDGKITRDLFTHEQNLIIEEEGKYFLFTGCAHNGIVNIVAHFQKLKGRMPDYIIGGFHLSGRSADGGEDSETIAEIANYLIATKATCYTGHCTGIEAYEQLKAMMGEQIEYIGTGRRIVI